MASDDLIAQDSSRQTRLMGTCWVIYGTIRIIAAVWLVSFANTAILMFGALLSRVPDPFTMMSVFHVFYTFVIALSGSIRDMRGVRISSGIGPARRSEVRTHTGPHGRVFVSLRYSAGIDTGNL